MSAGLGCAYAQLNSDKNCRDRKSAGCQALASPARLLNS